MEQETIDNGLGKPGKEMAAHITRELAWEERIEGSIFDSGPGPVTHRVYRLEGLSNLLSNMASFSVDFGALREWAGGTLGDYELADAIGAVLSEPVGETQEEADDDARGRIAALLELRVAQCAEELPEDAGGDEVGADGSVTVAEAKAG